MSRFAEFDHGPLAMINVDKIVSVWIRDEFDEDHDPDVEIYFSNHRNEEPLRLPWADWEVVRSKMVRRPNNNTRKEH